MSWVEVDSGTSDNVTVPSLSVLDSTFLVKDNADTTKVLQFQCSGITTATTRTLTVPDASDTIAGIAATQTLTNKTINLTSNTLVATSAQLATAVTDETGSGALVFGTSPTLTTPVIGSFASAAHNHTNAAGGAQITTAALSDYTEWTSFTPTRGAESGTWTAGTVTLAKYRKVGKCMWVDFQVNASSISATPQYLTITVPGGFTGVSEYTAPYWYNSNGGTFAIGNARVVGTSIFLYRDPTGTLWDASTTNASVLGQICFEVA